ncbi:hypothetical protein [Parerythrobacter jejuensis]|uniref:DUF4105 domain-containing protein n=1 Tax=Parerythrobacter jejuensis TaxID=795812 RepID=A0A845AT05_9SPHN|nr:hypothetical protein [Parerythrobacter jejuensis]MXP31252.1 hypothetical protein [Parerythrobacter jejuensis]MXP34012.1 hypothetical protein [Parerythrobacter jejuensis]
MTRFVKLFIAVFALAWSHAAFAEVRMHFHSFNGSVLFGRYPHAFVVLEGTLSNGRAVNENFGFSAKKTTPAILNGPVKQAIITETPKMIRKTNRHFTLTISDAQYRRIKAEMIRWRDAPGDYYSLETRNCIHFVGRMAELAGLRVEYPQKMLRRPKKWLNHITGLNPSLGASPIR